MGKPHVRIKASCGCGVIIAGNSAKLVLENIKQHSEDTGHGCEIHGTVVTRVKPTSSHHSHRSKELN